MNKKLSILLLAAVLLIGLAPAAKAVGGITEVGPFTGPHGFPLYYGDANGLQLELCLGNPNMCLFDPVDPANPWSVTAGFGAEAFWWMGEAQIDDPRFKGVLLVLAMEAAYGGDESVINGNQFPFGRIRIRLREVPTTGLYTVTHPYGTYSEVVTAGNDLNFTEDIGGFDLNNPPLGFSGALASNIGPYLVWPNYQLEPTLNLADGQYVGDPNVPHVVTGSPTGNNFFRVQGPGGIDIQTDLFSVQGRVYSGAPALAHAYPVAPNQNLAAVGPVNLTFDNGYPYGFPVYYEDFPGLQLTICPGSDPMCISDPIDFNDPGSEQLFVGGEAFWWAADSSIVSGGIDATLVLGLEAAFAGAEAIVDGNQIAFARVRIRVDVPVDGTYTITHPYGTQVFENVTVAEGINFTGDVGNINPFDYLNAFSGALFGKIGPFLTWPNYQSDPALLINGIQYVGDPAVPHVVTGGPNGNIFRVQGPGIDVSTNLFNVQGKVYDPLTYQTPLDPLAAIAINDTATVDSGVPTPIVVLTNDRNVQPAATVVLEPAGEIAGPFDGTAVVNIDNTITYTSTPGYFGPDVFAYRVIQDGHVSNVGFVNVEVLEVEALILRKAEVVVRTLRWRVEGEGAFPGSVITIRRGPALGTVIGQATADASGRWAFNGVAPYIPGTTSISLQSTGGATLLNQPLRVR